jgi:dipeptidyl aminopeptidase/acylaminoacyl peptidase
LISIGMSLSSLGPVGAHDEAVSASAELQAERVAMYERYRKFDDLVEGGSVTPGWFKDGNTFWFAEGGPDATVIWKIDPVAGSREPLFDTERIRAALTERLGHAPPYGGLPFTTFTLVEDEKAARFGVEGREFVVDLATYEVEEVEPPVANPYGAPKLVREGFTEGAPATMEVGSPNGQWFATEQDHDLWLRSSVDGRSERLTRSGEEDLEWSVAGAQWSPSSLKLAALRVDTRDVPRLPILYWLKTTEDVRWAPLAKAGQTIARSELYIVDVLTKQVLPIEGGDLADHYYNLVGWRDDGSELLFQRMGRTFQKLELLAADARNGKSRVVLSETSDTFIYALRYAQIWERLFTPVGDGERFVWISQRSGWEHLYLYNLDGTLERRLTDGAFPVLEVVKIDRGDGDRKGVVYFTAHGEKHDPYETQLYAVGLGGGKVVRLTEGAGQHDARFSPSLRFFIDTWSSHDSAPRTELRGADGKLLRTLSEADTGKLGELQWSPAERFVAKAADGTTELHGLLFKPWNFDPSRKYPVLDYIYNGPFTTWVPRTMLGRATQPRAIAQLGYVVFMVDGRGTPERGKAFQDVVYKQFGTNEIPDHAAALREVAASRPWIDLDRVGIYGGSWGGYMTVRALLTHPEVYHAGFAVNPVYDHYDHNAFPIEGYMGLPQDNREAYEKSSSIKLAGQLQGKLLLAHGALDTNATFSATMKMVAALIAAGKQHELIVLPDSTHWPRDKNAEYLDEAQRLFFERHLQPQRIVPAQAAD